MNNNYFKNVKSEILFWKENQPKLKNENILHKGITYNKFLEVDLASDSFNEDSLNINDESEKNLKKKNIMKYDNEHVSEMNFNIPKEQRIISEISSSVYNEEQINITSQKDRLLSSDSKINEKYEAFMFIKLNKSCNSEIIRNILSNMNLEKTENLNMISDICNYIISNFMTSLIPSLKSLMSNKLLKNHIKNELKNTINILEKVSNNVIIPVKKQKTKVSSKSIKNPKCEDDYEDDDGKFIQDSVNMNDELNEDDNNDINFEEMKNLWKNKGNN